MITFDEKQKIFKLDTPNTSYVFGIEDTFGYLVHFYYGPKISGTDLRYLSKTSDSVRVPSQNLRDKLSFMDGAFFEYPVGGIGDFRSHCLEICTESGHNAVEIGYVSHCITAGKKVKAGLPGTFGDAVTCDTLDITLRDNILNLDVILHYGVFNDVDAITRSVSIRNNASSPIYLTKVLSACIDMRNADFDITTLYGSWARERNIDTRKLGHGIQGVSSIRGETSHQEHPFIALSTPNTTQTTGEVYAMNFVYSGNFDANVGLDQFDNVRMMMGINQYNFKWKLMPDEEFDAPEVVMVMSDKGFGNMTRTFHDLYRNHLIRSKYKDLKRPILINNWEATYFDFDSDKLIDIAKAAHGLGIEMLVMDDGWFGNRFDDNRALGDWQVNEQKIKGGLKALVDNVNNIGMKFGIWFEPEMISPDSNLYRQHPDWAIAVPGRVAGMARCQYVLDISRDEVFEYVWSMMENILNSANIEYVKWDMNRQLADLGSLGLESDRQGELYHRYVLAVYRLQERLITKFPNLLLENCSGGGARFDPGMLYYSPQIWCSDDTDAIERLKIQEGTALVYPLSTMGAHVSDCPNHLVGRVTPFVTRGNVALAGTFGYELDITKISKEDREQIPAQVEMYHKYNDLVRSGDYYRIASYSQNQRYDCWAIKAKDESEILVTFIQVRNRPNFGSDIIRLQGLKPGIRYVEEGKEVVWESDVLMNAGFVVPKMWGDNQSLLIHFVKAD